MGMNIGADPALEDRDPTSRGKAYDDPEYQKALARLDVVILGFLPEWRNDTDGSIMRSAVRAMKALNPRLKVGQYTLLGEAKDNPATTFNDDLIVKLDQMNWWLRDAVTGEKLRWSTTYAAYDINITDWSPPDANGDRWPQWLARRDFARYFSPIPELDIWYFDGAMRHSRVPQAHWRGDGLNVSSQDAQVASRFRQAMAAHWATAAALAPTRLQLANPDNDLSSPEYKGRLQAAFLEGMMGRSWSLETRGWSVMMQRYFDVTANLASPALVGFNVTGAVDDYRFMRYAFASCRLGDAHFAYNDAAAFYRSVPWFDEYEVAFGAAVDPPTLVPWSNGVHRRRFERAMVLVNPQTDARTVTVEPGWRRILARQDPAVNDGTRATTLTLPPKDGLVLIRE
jgi:hypothetical protein